MDRAKLYDILDRFTSNKPVSESEKTATEKFFQDMFPFDYMEITKTPAGATHEFPKSDRLNLYFYRDDQKINQYIFRQYDLELINSHQEPFDIIYP